MHSIYKQTRTHHQLACLAGGYPNSPPAHTHTRLLTVSSSVCVCVWCVVSSLGEVWGRKCHHYVLVFTYSRQVLHLFGTLLVVSCLGANWLLGGSLLPFALKCFSEYPIIYCLRADFICFVNLRVVISVNVIQRLLLLLVDVWHLCSALLHIKFLTLMECSNNSFCCCLL